MFKNVLSTAAEFWKFNVFVIGENPVTIGKFIVGITFLIVGHYLIQFTTRRFQTQVLSKWKMNHASEVTVAKILTYLMHFFLTLIVLRILEIPLTAFTVLGGAFAIGLGFGLKNLVHNFVGGIILLLERPIRIDDFIEVDGIFGHVDSIGLRSTVVTSIDNTHVIIPNSTLLDNKVENWTLSNNTVRGRVRVGVSYDSDTRMVQKALLDVAKEHGQVLDRPNPSVLFSDFGDNALIFDLYVWADIKGKMGLRKVESDLRFMAFDRFRELDIVVAFPQVDVHFDRNAQQPISVN